MKKLNNKGYMLVEIILAFSICFALMYFLMDIVIKVKNKNDDLLVEATVKTDQAIITNRLMEYIINEKANFDCGEISTSNKAIYYRSKILTVIDDNVDDITINSNSCKKEGTLIKINIPIKVKQMADKNFDVNINYNYVDTTPPTCTMTVSGNTITASSSDTDWNYTAISADLNNSGWNKINDNTYTKTFNLAETYTFKVTDTSGNTGSCSILIVNKISWGGIKKCPNPFYGVTYTDIIGTDFCIKN